MESDQSSDVTQLTWLSPGPLIRNVCNRVLELLTAGFREGSGGHIPRDFRDLVEKFANADKDARGTLGKTIMSLGSWLHYLSHTGIDESVLPLLYRLRALLMLGYLNYDVLQLEAMSMAVWQLLSKTFNTTVDESGQEVEPVMSVFLASAFFMMEAPPRTAQALSVLGGDNGQQQGLDLLVFLRQLELMARCGVGRIQLDRRWPRFYGLRVTSRASMLIEHPRQLIVFTPAIYPAGRDFRNLMVSATDHVDHEGSMELESRVQRYHEILESLLWSPVNHSLSGPQIPKQGHIFLPELMAYTNHVVLKQRDAIQANVRVSGLDPIPVGPNDRMVAWIARDIVRGSGDVIFTLSDPFVTVTVAGASSMVATALTASGVVFPARPDQPPPPDSISVSVSRQPPLISALSIVLPLEIRRVLPVQPQDYADPVLIQGVQAALIAAMDTVRLAIRRYFIQQICDGLTSHGKLSEVQPTGFVIVMECGFRIPVVVTHDMGLSVMNAPPRLRDFLADRTPFVPSEETVVAFIEVLDTSFPDMLLTEFYHEAERRGTDLWPPPVAASCHSDERVFCFSSVPSPIDYINTANGPISLETSSFLQLQPLFYISHKPDIHVVPAALMTIHSNGSGHDVVSLVRADELLECARGFFSWYDALLAVHITSHLSMLRGDTVATVLSGVQQFFDQYMSSFLNLASLISALTPSGLGMDVASVPGNWDDFHFARQAIHSFSNGEEVDLARVSAILEQTTRVDTLIRLHQGQGIKVIVSREVASTGTEFLVGYVTAENGSSFRSLLKSLQQSWDEGTNSADLSLFGTFSPSVVAIHVDPAQLYSHMSAIVVSGINHLLLICDVIIRLRNEPNKGLPEPFELLVDGEHLSLQSASAEQIKAAVAQSQKLTFSTNTEADSGMATPSITVDIAPGSVRDTLSVTVTNHDEKEMRGPNIADLPMVSQVAAPQNPNDAVHMIEALLGFVLAWQQTLQLFEPSFAVYNPLRSSPEQGHLSLREISNRAGVSGDVQYDAGRSDSSAVIATNRADIQLYFAGVSVSSSEPRFAQLRQRADFLPAMRSIIAINNVRSSGQIGGEESDSDEHSRHEYYVPSAFVMPRAVVVDPELRDLEPPQQLGVSLSDVRRIFFRVEFLRRYAVVITAQLSRVRSRSDGARSPLQWSLRHYYCVSTDEEACRMRGHMLFHQGNEPTPRLLPFVPLAGCVVPSGGAGGSSSVGSSPAPFSGKGRTVYPIQPSQAISLRSGLFRESLLQAILDFLLPSQFTSVTDVLNDSEGVFGTAAQQQSCTITALMPYASPSNALTIQVSSESESFSPQLNQRLSHWLGHSLTLNEARARVFNLASMLQLPFTALSALLEVQRGGMVLSGEDQCVRHEVIGDITAVYVVYRNGLQSATIVFMHRNRAPPLLLTSETTARMILGLTRSSLQDLNNWWNSIQNGNIPTAPIRVGLFSVSELIGMLARPQGKSQGPSIAVIRPGNENQLTAALQTATLAPSTATSGVSTPIMSVAPPVAQPEPSLQPRAQVPPAVQPQYGYQHQVPAQKPVQAVPVQAGIPVIQQNVYSHQQRPGYQAARPSTVPTQPVPAQPMYQMQPVATATAPTYQRSGVQQSASMPTYGQPPQMTPMAIHMQGVQPVLQSQVPNAYQQQMYAQYAAYSQYQSQAYARQPYGQMGYPQQVYPNQVPVRTQPQPQLMPQQMAMQQRTQMPGYYMQQPMQMVPGMPMNPGQPMQYTPAQIQQMQQMAFQAQMQQQQSQQQNPDRQLGGRPGQPQGGYGQYMGNQQRPPYGGQQ